MIAKNTLPRPQGHPPRSESTTLNSSIADRARTRANGPVSARGRRCSDFVQEVLINAGAYKGRSENGRDIYGNSIRPAEVRPGDVVEIKGDTRYMDATRPVQYTTPEEGHSAIITGVDLAQGYYTVVEQWNDGKGPRESTVRLPTDGSAKFYRPVYQ